MGAIYKITNKLDNKTYIGQTQNVSERFKNHKANAFCKNEKNANNIQKLYRAFRKYGLDTFRFEVISDDIDNIQLDFWERYFICLYDSVRSGYNIAYGGNTPLGIKRSDEFKRKMSVAKKGTITSEATKELLRNIMLGVKRTQKTKDKMSKSMTGKPKSPEHRKHLSEAKKGKPFNLTEEGKKNLKAAQTKFIYTVVDPFGNISTTTNLDQFCHERGLDSSTMHKVANGHRIQYKAWKVISKVMINKTSETTSSQEAISNSEDNLPSTLPLKATLTKNLPVIPPVILEVIPIKLEETPDKTTKSFTKNIFSNKLL